MEIKFRCSCSITSALDVLGDKWILVIIKQMLIEGAITFKDFMSMDEAIATNILTIKLKQLEELQMVVKSKLKNNKKTNVYYLTEMALNLTPLILELAIWSDEFLRDIHPTMGDKSSIKEIKMDKEAYGSKIIKDYKIKINNLDLVSK